MHNMTSYILEFVSVAMQVGVCVLFAKSMFLNKRFPSDIWFFSAFCVIACRRISGIMEEYYLIFKIMDDTYIPFVISLLMFVGTYKWVFNPKLSREEIRIKALREEAIRQTTRKTIDKLNE